MTGRAPWRLHRKGNGYRLSPDRMTLASFLQGHGYTTAAIGKWHLGYQEGKTDYYRPLSPGPLDLGFDYHWGVPSNHGDIAGIWVENDHVFGMVEGMEDLPPELRHPQYNWNNREMLGIPAPYRTDTEEMTVLTEKAVEWIGEQSPEKPFFLYFAQSAIHAPHITSPLFKGSSGGGVYGDFIQELDHSLGEILKALDEGGFSENTLVLFTSDNGGHPAGGDEAIKAGLKINGDLRGTKLTIWEGGFKVPYILRWPGQIPPATSCDEKINLVDTYATLSALIGVRLPDRASTAEDSYNVLPAWLDEPYESPLREHMVLTSFEGITALHHGNWKYVDGVVPDPDPNWLFGPRLEEVNEMLFDLSEDPLEEHNVFADYPEIAKEMKSLLTRIRKQGYSRN
jgi:arylsulfatase A-like enzyme